jgi:hypothetical protein
MNEGNPIRWKDATTKSASKSGIALLLVCLCFLIGALAAQPAIAEEHVSDKWQFSVSPYMWALSLQGYVTVKGQKNPADIDFNDIWDNLNFAAMVEVEARKNRWGVFVNPLLAQLEVDPDPVDVTIDLDIIAFGGFYRFGPWPLRSEAGSSGPVLVTDIYAGGRYTYIKLDIHPNVSGFQNVAGDENWVDPIIGVRTLWFLAPRWTLMVSGDIGGGTGSG